MASLLISNTPTSSSCPGTGGWQRDEWTRWRGTCGGVWWRGVKSEVCVYCVQNSVQDEKASGGATKIIHVHVYIVRSLCDHTVRTCALNPARERTS